ncbi:YhcN/YlaJ family sporulation lipoprotein [Paenibacillus sp. USDA918EY]|uniref:YhcN/YlaJ family sporulation lipoprotein n=1 Tax=Paenibacillus sp. USDA918EY TaxID=2689575 RepID=UPI001359AB48|nr:YhcN/YlaJ family sporulation lipoprotein [Paenibacillus sp. USDA918EY]
MMRSKVISLSVSAALLASVVGVTGCTTREPANTNVRTKNVHDGRMLNTRDGRLNVNSLRDGNRFSTYNTDGNYGMHTARHDLTNVTSSQEIADKVAAMKEVRTANVLKAGNSAYVAVSLEHGAQANTSTTGTHGRFRSNSFGTMNTGIGSNSSFNNSSAGVTNRGTTGMGTGTTGMGTTGTDGMTGLGTGTTGTGLDGHYRGYTTGTGVPITRGNGFNATTPGTAGTSHTYSQNYNVTSDVKDKITSVVKKADPNITNVYVSANPDFVQHVSNYATNVKSGHPVSGMVSQLSNMIERIFPTNTSTTDHRVTPMGTTPTAPLGKTPAGRHIMTQ